MEQRGERWASNAAEPGEPAGATHDDDTDTEAEHDRDLEQRRRGEFEIGVLLPRHGRASFHQDLGLGEQFLTSPSPPFGSLS